MAKSCKKLGKRVGLMAGYMSLLQVRLLIYVTNLCSDSLVINYKICCA
jgi:hypothetical protein